MIEASCHCGAIRLTCDDAPTEVTSCNCSICTKKGFLHLIVPKEQFELLRGEGELSTYRFNTGVAAHHFCCTCGIHSFYVPRSDPDKVDVNVRCLDGVDAESIEPKPFDGQHWEEAIQTRD